MSRGNKPRIVRSAVYTRKSTDEGLEQEFNTLDAQREAGENYIESQRHEGWRVLAEHFDDGGYSGATLERPALKRMFERIEAGVVDAVIVYKIDRLTRSLADFAKLMEVFDAHGVALVSVTQQLNTGTSMGRLMLHVLLSFAQFEREMIAERTRDKLAAARRRGKWAGGSPVLGYDLVNSKLAVNAQEAERVRAIYALYLELGSLRATVRELGRHGWRNKQWTTRKGTERGGAAFRKNSLQHLLTNVVYLGKVRHHDQVYDGEHEAIVAEELFEAVGRRLRQQRRWMPGKASRSNGALLTGLVHCTPCGARMDPRPRRQGSEALSILPLRKRLQWRGAALSGVVPAGGEARAVCARGTPGRRKARRGQWRVGYCGRAARATPTSSRADRLRRRHGQPHHSPAQRRLELMKATATISRTIFFDSTPQVRPHPEPQHPAGLSGRVPRVARLLALAIRFEQLVADGVVENYAELARLGYVSRARLSQIANLRYLASDIQEEILFLPAEASGREPVTERALRPLAAEPDWRVQRRMWWRAKGRASPL